MSISATLYAYPPGGAGRTIGFVRSIEIQRTEARHDLITIGLDLASLSGLEDLNDSPGMLSMTWSGITYTYRGYLDVGSPGRVRGASQGNMTTVYLMGESNVMRSSHARSWRATNPFSIARAVIDEYQLGVEMDQYQGVMQFISQTGEESDWQFLVRLASDMGYSLVTDGVVVRFVNVRREHQRAPYRACPVYYLPPGGNGTPMNVETCTVKSTGSPIEADYRSKSLAGMTETGNLFSLDTSVIPSPRRGVRPSFTAPGTLTYQSMSDAMQEAERIRNQARWAYQMTIASSASIEARVGRHVMCVDPLSVYNGYWYVTDVKHIINTVSGLFKTQVIACREELAPLPPFPAASPDVVGMSPPEPSLVNSRWRSSRQWSRLL